MIYDKLNDAIFLIEQAKQLTNACAELSAATLTISTNDLQKKGTEAYMNAWELLRTHDTCGVLLLSLLDVLERLEHEIDTAMSLEQTASDFPPRSDKEHEMTEEERQSVTNEIISMIEQLGLIEKEPEQPNEGKAGEQG